jgi:hypothetical protein
MVGEADGERVVFRLYESAPQADRTLTALHGLDVNVSCDRRAAQAGRGGDRDSAFESSANSVRR